MIYRLRNKAKIYSLIFRKDKQPSTNNYLSIYLSSYS